MALGLVALAAGAAAPVRAAPPVVVLTQGEPGDPAARFAERLKDALTPSSDVTLQRSENGPAVLSRVLGDPAQVAFVQRDAFVALGRADRNVRTSLEVYGSLPACAVTLVRATAEVRSHGDLAAARRDGEPITIDVGPAGGWAATTFAILRELDATVAHMTIENRGGARALSRVLAGETDALLAIAYDGALEDSLSEAVASGALLPAALLGTTLPRVAALHGLPYATSQVELGRSGFLGAGRSYDTICTSFGVAVNTGADASVAEAVARAAVSGRLATSNRSWLREAVAYAGDTVTRTAAEAQRVAASIVEPGLAWIARIVLPADPNGRKPSVRPASNLKGDDR